MKEQKMAQETTAMARDWETNPRWQGIERPYTAAEVMRLRGTVRIDYTLAKMGAEKLWGMLQTEPYINSLGAATGNQAVQMIEAGLRAVYVSGWQTAADANLSAQTYPDQSLYPVNSVPALCRRLNNALLRADQIQHMNDDGDVDYIVPLVADAEAGFGGNLNAYELTRDMIESGAAGIHFEDQLSSAKKCGHLGGKVLVPTREAIAKLVAARLAADVMDVPTLIIARTDADAASLITSDIDERDRPLLTGERTVEGFYGVRHGMEAAVARGLSYAPYADMIWMETGHPDLDEARTFAEAIHRKYPGKMLMYNCSPSFNWKRQLDDDTIAKFQRELGAMGYKFQFITLAGFHAINLMMFELARGYRDEGMTAYSRLQQREFEEEAQFGYRAVKHQTFVGTGFFDLVQQTIMGGMASTTALEGSTETEQFDEPTPHVTPHQ